MSHLDEGTLHAMLDGELSSDEVAEAQAHLEECAQCRASLAEAKDFFSETDVLIESLDEPSQPLIDSQYRAQYATGEPVGVVWVEMILSRPFQGLRRANVAKGVHRIEVEHR